MAHKATAAAPLEALRDEAVALLRSVGQRVTKPRVAVLTCVLQAEGEHLSAETLLEQVAELEPTVHRATVYRTLDGLTRDGVLRHVHLDRGLTAYHLAGQARSQQAGPHLHAQCTRCGAVTDLPPGVLGDAEARVRRATGFRLDASHVALSGLCASCAASP
ncbi:MAG TPA: Fur family transcriptional regulator [Mycobacteriales bacterium]|nr:Fur family transcriptional regulator [Mycobacteriales bacterium]